MRFTHGAPCPWCSVAHEVEVPDEAFTRWFNDEVPWRVAWPEVDPVTLGTLTTGMCAEAQDIANTILGRKE